jgi:hypothetical protein
VLSRAAAEQQPDTQSFGHVVVSRIGLLAGDFAERGGIGQPASMRVGAEQRVHLRGEYAAIQGRDADRRGSGKRSIDRWTAINGVDPLAGLR